MKTQKRYLSHLLLLNGEILHNHICTIDADGNISAEPFAGETASTVFINGILVSGSEKLAEHLNDLWLLIKNCNSSDLRKQAEIVSSYIINNNLTGCETKNTVLISIEGEGIIIHNA